MIWNRKRGLTFPTATELIPRRDSRVSAGAVPTVKALTVGAVWACLRLRSNLMSCFPVDVFRRVEGFQVEVPKPPVVLFPGGARCDWSEWIYSTQFDLDRVGNCFGLIMARDGSGIPSLIQLVGAEDVTVQVRSGALAGYRIGSTVHDPLDVWHEKQYTMAGLHVGLSPLAYAALTIGEFGSLRDFATSWFQNNAMPGAVLKNNARTIARDNADEMKDRYRSTVDAGGLFVIGQDWDFSMMTAAQSTSQWVDGKSFDVVDICRFFDVPADVIDAAVMGQNITYANLTQRNLQLLIHHLAPAIGRRERALSNGLLSDPRYLKLNTDALLRMDPAGRSAMFAEQIASRQRTPNECRQLDNFGPLTDSQYSEFDRLFARQGASPVPGARDPGSISVVVPERSVHITGPTVNVPERSTTVNVPERELTVTVEPPNVLVEPVITVESTLRQIPSGPREKAIVRDERGQIVRITEYDT